MTEIGSKYEKTRSNLRERIRNGKIDISKRESIDHMCYFCKQRIIEDMYVLTDKKEIGGIEVETKYFLDHLCYNNSKEIYH